MKRIKTVYLDTTYTPSLDEVNEYLEINELEPAEDDNCRTYWDAVYELRQADIDDVLYEIEHSKKFGKDTYAPCIVCGSLGLWDGRHDIQPEKFNNLHDAVWACINNMDDFIIKQNCSCIEVTALHHDGRNAFCIYFLNQRGEDAYERWNYLDGKADLYHRIYHKTLTDYLW